MTRPSGSRIPHRELCRLASHLGICHRLYVADVRKSLLCYFSSTLRTNYRLARLALRAPHEHLNPDATLQRIQIHSKGGEVRDVRVHPYLS